MEYKDAVGTDIQRGDTVAYTTMEGRIQIGRVLELTTSPGYSGRVAALKVQGARRSWNSATFTKFSKPSTIRKLENVLVLGANLPAMLALI